MNTSKPLSPNMSIDEDHWGAVASSFRWKKRWKSLCTGNFHDVNIKWFEGAELNITENIFERNLEHRSKKTALIFEPNDPQEKCLKYTYQDLHREVNKMANLFKKYDIKKGDVVCLYMGMTPELMFGILACARIGAIHSVVFGGFSAESLKGRIEDCQAKLLLTHDEAVRGDKVVALKNIADVALEQCPSIKNVIVVQRTKGEISMKPERDVFYHEAIKEVHDYCEFEIMQAEDPMFILYTSGSTGKPKGLLHTCAGYMVHAGYSFKEVFQYKESDIFWCTADIGWITGHTYVTYGPLLNGATTVMFEGVPTWPSPARSWEIIEKHHITHFYTAPTAIRALEALGTDIPKQYEMKSLKVLGSVGEPINEEAWHWYDQNVGKGRCPIVDTWWQTETGGIMISPKAFFTKTKPAHATLPLQGVEPVLVDPNGQLITEKVAEGNLCLAKPWPSMARTIWGDHERFKQTYFSTYPGLYFTGDGAKRDEDGYYRILGRVDDVINVSGHRLGTAEIESAIDEHDDVVESAVVGYPHNIKGQGIYAFVICHHARSDHEQLEKEIRDVVTKMIGPIAKPDLIQIVPGLPKTRSGKIMRRILRKVAENELSNIGDTSTLLNPEVVEAIIKGKRA